MGYKENNLNSDIDSKMLSDAMFKFIINHGEHELIKKFNKICAKFEFELNAIRKCDVEKYLAELLSVGYTAKSLQDLIGTVDLSAEYFLFDTANNVTYWEDTCTDFVPTLVEQLMNCYEHLERETAIMIIADVLNLNANHFYYFD